MNQKVIHLEDYFWQILHKNESLGDLEKWCLLVILVKLLTTAFLPCVWFGTTLLCVIEFNLTHTVDVSMLMQLHKPVVPEDLVPSISIAEKNQLD